MNHLFVTILLLTGSSGGSQPILTDEQIRLGLDPIGTCEAAGRAIDMRSVMFLENRSIQVTARGEPLTLYIRGENFYAKTTAAGSGGSLHHVDVDSEIDINDDLDIELKFAYYDAKLTLYWKETFQNRIYRQGLFSVNGHELTRLCEGQGGSHAEP